MELTRKQVIEELKAILEIQYWNVPLSKAALEYAISSLKTDEAYRLMYEGGEVYDKDTVAWMFRELQLEIEKLDTPNNSDAYMTCAELIQQKINALGGDD